MNEFNKQPSVLIIGGKLLGLASAIEIKKRCPEVKISVIEREAFLTSDGHIIDKSATLSSTKTLHTGTYYTHRGHSRGKDPKEKQLLINLTEETSRDYVAMMKLLKEYRLAPKGKSAQTLYLMFQDAFVEPFYFENIAKKRGLWIRRVPLKEFKRLKKIFSKYESINGKPLKLKGAFYSKDSLIDLVSLLKKIEQKAKKLGVNLIEKATIIRVDTNSVTIESNGIEEIIEADCIINTTSAFTAQTAKMLTAKPPPEDSYKLQYRHIGWVDKKAVSIFNDVSQGKLSYFRIFQGEYKVTFAEVIGVPNKISFYAPELIRVPNNKPNLPFSLNSKRNPSLLKTMERWKIHPKNKNFQAYIGLAAYMTDGKNLFHESKTKTGIPVMNSIIEKMSGFISASLYISKWVQNALQKKIAITVVGAGHYGRSLVSPKYKEMSQAIIKSVISPTISEKTLSQGALSGIPLYRSVGEWRKKEIVTNRDVFDLAVHFDVLPKIVQELARIGAKNFIFPKPIALTKNQLSMLIKIKKKYKLNIVIASQWYYSNLTKKLKQLLYKKRSKIRRIECNFSQNFDSRRLKKYTPTTALIPHILQIVHSTGVIGTKNKFTIIEYTPFKILFKIKTSNDLEILIKSDISSKKKERNIKIFLDNDIITADYSGKIIKGKWIIYPSVSYRNQAKQIVEDNLAVMLERIIHYFASHNVKSKNGELLTLDKYLPVSRIQIELEREVAKL